MEGSFVNIIKDGALFPKGHKVEGFLIKLNKEEGVLGKCAPLSFLPTAEQGREGGSPAAARAGGPGARGRPGSWGKERWGHGGLIPLSNFMEGDLQGGARRPWSWRANDGQGRRKQGGVGVVGMRGERGREVRGSDPWP